MLPLLAKLEIIDTDSVCQDRLVKLLAVIRPELEFVYHTVGIDEESYNLLVFQQPNKVPMAMYKNLDDDGLILKLCEYITFKR